MVVCQNCGDGFHPTETSDGEFCSWECHDEHFARLDLLQDSFNRRGA